MTWPYWYTGHPDRALEVCEASIRLGRQAGYLFAEAFDQGRLGQMLGELGATDSALERLRQAESAAKLVGMAGLGTILSARLHLELNLGQMDQAAATVRQMETDLLVPPIWEVDALLRARTELALAQGDQDGALAHSQAHIARLRELGLALYLPEALAFRARALEQAGGPHEALDCLSEARDRAQALAARAIEWPVLYAWGRLAARLGRPVEAEAAWAEARAIVNEFAGRVPTPELRASFLARPDVSELLAGQPTS
jgi:tetratricopeptide (TPR) repeat protein